MQGRAFAPSLLRRGLVPAMAAAFAVPALAFGTELPSSGTYRPVPDSVARQCTGKACVIAPFEGQILLRRQDLPSGSLGTLVTYVTFPLEEGDFDVVIARVGGSPHPSTRLRG